MYWLQAGIVASIISMHFLGLTIVSRAAEEPTDTLIESTEIESTCVLKSNNTEIKLPASYSEDTQYPAVVILPATWSTPARAFRGSFANAYEARTEDPFIVILFDIEGNQNDWDPGENFQPAVARCEELVIGQLNDLIPQYNIDPSRVVLAGSSLGGDFSWALNVRNPDVFQGAVIFNSMSTQPVDSLTASTLAEQNTRFFMTWQEGDSYDRLPHVRTAVDKLALNNINHRFEIFPMGGVNSEEAHHNLQTNTLMRGLEYVLFGY